MAGKTNSTDAALKELRAFGLSYPGAHTKSPWPGHLDLAVNDKTFAYLSVEGDPFHISCKLPHSSEEALSLPFVTPAAYGLGKSGWVNAELPDGPIPIELFQAWIDESYRAQAPKRLLRTLPETFAEAVAAFEPASAVRPRPAAKTRTKASTSARTSATTPKAAKTRATASPAAKNAPARKAAGKTAAARTPATNARATKAPATKARAARKSATKPVAKRRSAAVP